ncbi:MAG: sulfite exporter TauE/SafE family protein, partial [Rubrobacter sp.]
GWGIKDAVAASLVIIIFSSATGTLRSIRSENPPDWRMTAILASAIAPASLIGVFISNASPDYVVQVAFAAMLLALAYPTARGGGPSEREKKMPLPLVLLAGVVIGALSGLVGIGGGTPMVALMMLGLGLSTKRAVSTSLAITIFVGIVSSVGYIVTGFSELSSLPLLVVGAMAGAWLGVRLREWLPENALRIGFAIFMVVVALRLLADAASIL